MKQRGITIVSPIASGRIDDLDIVLRRVGDNIAKQNEIPFDSLTLLHYASWVIFREGKPGPQLIFECNFDGEVEMLLRQIVERARSGLDTIYQHCEGYPIGGSAEAVRSYFESRTVNTDTFYVSCGGYTREQIVQEARLREKIEEFLGGHAAAMSPSALRGKIQEFVRRDPELGWAQRPAPPYTLSERLRVRDGVIVVLLAVVPTVPALWLGWLWPVVLVLIFGILYLTLRWKERTDPSISDQPVEDALPDPKHVERLAKREDRRPQNHLASVTIVKPGLFRLALLKTVLAGIEALGRLIYYKGSLSGIPSIHFARWAVINGGEHLLFLSNFDGSWEHYLGEFIDQAAGGLTAVWSNAVKFPRSRNLVGGGAADEQRFKAYARTAQLYTQLWYSAYPFLSVVNIRNNAAIRAQLWEAMNATDADRWLRRF